MKRKSKSYQIASLEFNAVPGLLRLTAITIKFLRFASIMLIILRAAYIILILKRILDRAK
jgi:hypothetical protein